MMARIIVNAVAIWVGLTVINDISYNVYIRQSRFKAFLFHPIRYIKYQGQPIEVNGK